MSGGASEAVAAVATAPTAPGSALAPPPRTAQGHAEDAAGWWVVWTQTRRAPGGPWRATATFPLGRGLAEEHAARLRRIGRRWHRRVSVAREGDPPPAWASSGEAAAADSEGGRRGPEARRP